MFRARGPTAPGEVLELALLGTPAMRWQGAPVASTSRRVVPLLAYLALSPRPVARRDLIDLLWESGRAVNLRQELAKVRALPGAASWFLDDGAGNLHLRVASDVAALEAALAREEYGAIAETWRSRGGVQMLEGLDLDFLPSPYHEWLEFRRERVENLFVEALPCRAQELEAIADLPGALELHRDLVRIDPLNETAHQEIIRLEAVRGRPAAALRQFEKLRRTLARELRVEPRRKTIDLAASVPDLATGRAGRPPASSRGLPEPVTAFVGRTRELLDLQRTLAEPDRRLITLLGMGGVGKTRLAVEAARRNLQAFPDGVVFVPLAQLDEAAMLPGHVARLLDLPQDGETVKERLFGHVEASRILFVFDNVEHLPAAADFVHELLGRAPASTALATSRSPLNLRIECKYPVDGLDFPPSGAGSEGGFDAVTLFVQSARRRPGGFAAAPDELVHVHEVCSVLRGVPLAIELAASLTDAMPVAAIAHELAVGNFDVLAADHRDRPSRHRAMRTVLQSTWHLLDEADRSRMMSLSVFRGRFGREAARAVADVGFHDLLRLKEKALVVQETTTSFVLHDAVKWFAADRLAATPDGARAARERNLRAAEHYRLRLGSTAPTSTDHLEPWLQAFNYLVLAEAYDEACRFLIDFDVRLLLRWGQAEAILEMHQKIAPHLTDDYLRGRGFNSMGLALGRLGRLDEAIDHYRRALAISRTSGDRINEANYLGNLGIANNLAGHLRVAIDCHEEAVSISRELGDIRSMGIDLGCLGLAYNRLGDPDTAIARHRQALEASTNAGDTNSIANHLGNLAHILRERGDPVSALAHANAALAIRRDLNDRRGEAIDLLCLAELHATMDAPLDALEHYQAALALNRSIGERIGESDTLFKWGRFLLRRGDRPGALARVRQALALSRSVGDAHMETEILASLATIVEEEGDTIGAIAVRAIAVASLPEQDSKLGDELRASLEAAVRAAAPQEREYLLMHGSELLLAATGQPYVLPHLDLLRRWSPESSNRVP